MQSLNLSRTFDAPPGTLVFAPLAWLKLQWFCHQGDTEIGGFGITAEKNPLYVEEFVTVVQTVTPMTVRFDDKAIADFFDTCVDKGLRPERFARIWLHTHPGSSADPSGTDEKTFASSFGRCDWAVMFILSRAARTYARLAFSAGPGAAVLIPVAVDWAALPEDLARAGGIDAQIAQWRADYDAHVQPAPLALHLPSLVAGEALANRWDALPWSEDWDGFFYEPANPKDPNERLI